MSQWQLKGLGSFSTHLKNFFLSPVPYSKLPKRLKESGERSTLYLLRRDLQRLYFSERRTYAPENRKAISMLATIGMLTGLDILSKFHSPQEEHNGKRFKKFLEEVLDLEKWKRDFLWDLRNALMHSYSLTIDRGQNKGKFIRFSTDEDNPSQEWVVQAKLKNNGREGFNFFFWEFKDYFRWAVGQYKDRLRKQVKENPQSDECQKFIKAYRDFGKLQVKTAAKKTS